MIAYPNAKINLGLNILRKRDDGFHAIESVFYPIPWKDLLEVVVDEYSAAGSVTFTSSGIPVPSDGKPNLCERTYGLLHQLHELPAIKMHLHKMIPIGAGLGGGSADAAFALNVLNKLFQLSHTTVQLENLAAQLGSDCPFFVANTPKLVSGRGEVMVETSVNLAGYHVAVAYPNIHISTAEAYAGVRPAVPELSVEEIVALPVAQWKSLLKNDFENSLFLRYPELAALKAAMYAQGAVYASMTGSGSAVYGIFASKPVDLAFSEEITMRLLEI